jgi:hypothetical protein
MNEFSETLRAYFPLNVVNADQLKRGADSLFAIASYLMIDHRHFEQMITLKQLPLHFKTSNMMAFTICHCDAFNSCKHFLVGKASAGGGLNQRFSKFIIFIFAVYFCQLIMFFFSLVIDMFDKCTPTFIECNHFKKDNFEAVLFSILIKTAMMHWQLWALGSKQCEHFHILSYKLCQAVKALNRLFMHNVDLDDSNELSSPKLRKMDLVCISSSDDEKDEVLEEVLSSVATGKDAGDTLHIDNDFKAIPAAYSFQTDDEDADDTIHEDDVAADATGLDLTAIVKSKSLTTVIEDATAPDLTAVIASKTLPADNEDMDDTLNDDDDANANTTALDMPQAAVASKSFPADKFADLYNFHEDFKDENETQHGDDVNVADDLLDILSDSCGECLIPTDQDQNVVFWRQRCMAAEKRLQLYEAIPCNNVATEPYNNLLLMRANHESALRAIEVEFCERLREDTAGLSRDFSRKWLGPHPFND